VTYAEVRRFLGTGALPATVGISERTGVKRCFSHRPVAGRTRPGTRTAEPSC
jgi:hypothetical protein